MVIGGPLAESEADWKGCSSQRPLPNPLPLGEGARNRQMKTRNDIWKIPFAFVCLAFVNPLRQIPDIPPGILHPRRAVAVALIRRRLQ